MDVQKARRLTELPFPFRLAKRNNHTGAMEKVKFDVLTPSNLAAYRRRIQAWESGLKGKSLKVKELYRGQILEEHAEYCSVLDASQFPSSEFISRIIIFASTKEGLEGIANLFATREPPLTTLSFIGLAPWNLKKRAATPKLTQLSHDLARLSLMFALRAAANAKDEDDIFHADFVTTRSVEFAKRFFSIPGMFPHEMSFSINKRGVIAFLDGDHETFRMNYTATPVFSILPDSKRYS